MDKLSYEGFVNVIRDGFPLFMGEEYSDWHMEERKVYKINRIMHAFNYINKERPVNDGVANIYINEYYKEYEKGRTIKSIMEEMRDTVIRYKGVTMPNDFMDISAMKDRIMMVLINAKINSEYLMEIPHRRIMDLAIVYRAVTFIDDVHSVGAMLTNNMLKELGVNEEELHCIAMDNMNRITASQALYVEGMIVCTNDKRMYGAYNGICDIDMLKHISENSDDDLYIIPSSIHETFVIPCSDADERAVRELIIGAVRDGIVGEEDYLSDSLYRYDRVKQRVELA